MKAPALVLLGAAPALAVAAAWWASSGGEDDALRAEVADLRDRVAMLEQRDDASRETARAAQDEVATLTERVIEAELRAARGAHAASSRSGVGDAPKDEPAGRDGVRDTGADGAGGWGARPVRGKHGKGGAHEGAEADKVIDGLDAVSKSLSDRMSGLKSKLATMELRGLPEEQRWQRAMKDVGLNQNQVDVLRQAIADRDTAYAAVTTKEWRVEDDGTKVGETRTDEAAVQEADRRYESATHGVMTSEQAERWRTLGFAGAFGGGRPSNRVQRYPRKR